jgi:hypothetical protein
MDGLVFVQTLVVAMQVVIAALLLWFTKNMVGGSALSAVASRLDEMNKILIDRPELYVQMKSDMQPDDSRSEYHFMSMMLTLFEEAFLLHKRYRLLDGDIFTGWEATMRKNLSSPYAAAYWTKFQGEYTPSFVEYMNQKRFAPPPDSSDPESSG